MNKRFTERYRIVEEADRFSLRNIVYREGFPFYTSAPLISFKTLEEFKTFIKEIQIAIDSDTIKEKELTDIGEDIDS